MEEKYYHKDWIFRSLLAPIENLCLYMKYLNKIVFFFLSSAGQVLFVHQSFEQHDIIKIQCDAKIQILKTNIYDVNRN